MSDVALSLEIMSGDDDYDSTVSPQKVPVYSALNTWEGGAKIAYFDSMVSHQGLGGICEKGDKYGIYKT